MGSARPGAGSAGRQAAAKNVTPITDIPLSLAPARMVEDRSRVWPEDRETYYGAFVRNPMATTSRRSAACLSNAAVPGAEIGSGGAGFGSTAEPPMQERFDKAGLPS